MKRLLLFFAVLLISSSSMGQSPRIRLLGVDSVGNNIITPFYMPQVAISGYFENLLHIPTLTINGATQSLLGNPSFTVTASVPTNYLTSTSPFNILSKTASYTLLSTDFASTKQAVLYLIVDCTAGNNTQTLPTTGIPVGTVVYITKTDATSNYLTIAGLSSDNIISIKGSVKMAIFNGTTWTQN